MPHPPSTYTPVSETYGTTPTQPNYGAPAASTTAAAAPPPAAPPPANADQAASAYPYPKQSLFDLFSNKTPSQ